MKALILKDLYNLKKYIKSMIVMIIIFTFVFIKAGSVDGLVTMASILFGMMIMNTFTFDDVCNWERYCLTTPIRKRDIILSKFIVLFILSFIGILVGFIATIYGSICMERVMNKEFFGTMGLLVIVGFSISEIFGSTIMPIIYKFGVEKARNFLIVTYLIPTGITLGIYKLLLTLGVIFTEKIIFIIMMTSPIIALLWNVIMYIISLKFFEKKEF